ASKRQYDPKMGVAARCVAFAQGEGLIVRALAGHRLAVCPLLIIAPAEIDALFDRLGRALDRTRDWIRAERLEAVPGRDGPRCPAGLMAPSGLTVNPGCV
ncbi:hypothetical protein MKK75_19720, partial [Methylobacterium sp. J-030]|nr:hypothetical protein [Methylobacterium sp. J-030]